MTRSNARIIGASMLAVGVLLLCALPLAAQDNNTYIQHATRFGVSPPLRELAKLPQQPHYGFREANPIRRIPKRTVGPVVDTVEQSSAPAGGVAYSIGANILGVGNGFPNYSVPDAPPDTTMAVGDTQVVQWVNTSYTVCNKSTGSCGPAIEGNTLWQNLGGPCFNENDGDIIAQWDVKAHRWLLAQNDFDFNGNLNPPYYVCVAISTSNDATGTYYLYQFPVVNNGFPDYPKWGTWVNNYGQTWNNFGPGANNFVGPVLCAYNRTKLLAGDNTAEQICHQYTSSEDSLLPADIDSITPPPNGEDQFAIGSVGDVDNSHLSLYSVHINNPERLDPGRDLHWGQQLAVDCYCLLHSCLQRQLRRRLRSAERHPRLSRLSGRSLDVPLRLLGGPAPGQRESDSAEAGTVAALAGEFRCDRLRWAGRHAVVRVHCADQGRPRHRSRGLPAGHLRP